MGSDTKLPTTVNFHFVKSQYFRVMHADGAWGGLSPNGMIHMSVYSERFPIPQSLEQNVTPEGRIEGEASKVTRDGVIREVDADIVMTRDVAVSIRDWLTARIDLLDEVLKSERPGAAE